MSMFQAPYHLKYSDGARRPFIQLQANRHFRLYPIGLRDDVRETLTARMIDLLRLGMAISVVDGLVRRSRSAAGYRNPHLEVEVLEPAFWNSPDVSATLKNCVDFLSGDDDWQIRFVPDPTTRHHYQPQLRYIEPSIVCLYSGGLDSAAGLALRLRDRPDRTIIPVIARHQFFRGKLVGKQLRLLKRKYKIAPGRLLPLFVAAFVRNRRLHLDRRIRVRETTHRCRSFLFAALAGVVAAVQGSDSVEVYESGIGAVNLPLMSGMSGWRTTRSTHPYFLAAMSHLVKLVVDRPISFELPFKDRTKGMMVSDLNQEGLSSLARSTVSCILHPIRRGRKQCGVCPACVYRRYAMQAAGISEPRHAYLHDLFGSMAEFQAIPEKRLNVLNLFLRQIDDLSELDEGVMPPEFFLRHLVNTKIIADKSAAGPFVSLFRKYRQEWLELAARGQTEGWPWADWLVPAGVAVA
jgi:7-cyano-7-deazaguanine synthase in queuosine biosynthesis